MVFSSISFIYYLLPLILLVYFIVPSKYRNIVLLIFSLLFYFYGEPKYIIILILSCIVNYIFGLLIEKKHSKCLLVISITFNLLMLSYFKYTNFLIDNINSIIGTNIKSLNVIMPIGISFFTFQAMSYVIDVYTKKVKATKNFINFSTYVCLFPQLVAGPIVRYSTINEELVTRKTSFNLFGEGVKRFIVGLGKKVLIANVIGEMCSILLGLNELSVLSYILVALGYTIQIYFDFSGYSDMAIGLGKMFGFNFLENFNYPLIADSITDFWRRWHISLSSFLKDYVYIPLGGNRVSKIKHIRNIFVVWCLTGLWHGAAWNFIIWGLYFAVLLLIEKFFLKKFLDKHKIISHIYTIFFVLISFVIFSVPDMASFFLFMKNMLGLGHLPFINTEVLYYLRSYSLILIISFIASTPILKVISKRMENTKYNKYLNVLEVISLIIVLTISTAYLVDSSFNPFLYFRF